MQTLKIELTDKNSLKALHELESKNLIRIVNEPDLNSYALPGETISREDFVEWIKYAENNPTVNFMDAKKKWEDQKKQLNIG